MEDKLKVVVADDIKVLADNMQSIVAGNPRVEKVWTAYDGEEEIIQIMKLEPDIVFTDMQMPKRTGLEVIETIKEYPSVRKRPKFVLVTADRDNQLILKSRELNFDIEYKPINPQRINEYINEYEAVETNSKEEERKMNEEIEEVRKKLKKESFFKKVFKKK